MLLSPLKSMSQTQACAKCINEGGNIQERSHALDAVANSEQDNHDIYLRSSTSGIITCLHTSDDKQSPHDQPSSNKDFDVALKLFPEFLSKDTQEEWKRSSCAKARGKVKCLFNTGENHKITEHLKRSKDIVEWIRKEYGM